MVDVDSLQSWNVEKKLQGMLSEELVIFMAYEID
jgi:hypothetical protein